MLNNATQLKNQPVPPPQPMQTSLNVQYGKPTQIAPSPPVQLNTLNKIPLPPSKTQIPVEYGPTVKRPEMNINNLAGLVGTSQKANSVNDAAGFKFEVGAGGDPVSVYKSNIESVNNNLNKLGIQQEQITKEIDNIQKNIDKIYQETDPTVIQTELSKFISDASKMPKQQFVSSRDFFVEKGADGKERLSKRGQATLILGLLGNIFGVPQQRNQTTALVMGLGDKFAKEQNLINEANFKQAVQDYNTQIRNYQTQIGIKQSERQSRLGPQTSRLNQYLKQLEQNNVLTRDQLNKGTEFAEKMGKALADSDKSQRDKLINVGTKLYFSAEPLDRINGYLLLTQANIDIPNPGIKLNEKGELVSEPTIKQRKEEAGIAKTEATTEKIGVDTGLAVKKDARAEAELELKRGKFKLDEKAFNERLRHNKVMEGISNRNANTAASMSATQRMGLQFSLGYAKTQLADVDKKVSESDAKIKKLQGQKNGLGVIEDPAQRAQAQSIIDGQINSEKESNKGLKEEQTKLRKDLGILNPFIQVIGEPGKKTSMNKPTRLPGTVPAPQLVAADASNLAKSLGLPEGVPAFVNPTFFPRKGKTNIRRNA